MQKNRVTTFYIIRHAQSEANITEVIGGNSKLTKRGKKQASIVGKQLKNINFSEIYSSDLLRTKETAELINNFLGLKLNIVRKLRERSWGSLDGIKEKRFQEQYKDNLDKYNNATNQEKLRWKFIEDMESIGEAAERIVFCLKDLAKKHRGKHVLIVSHNTLIRSLLIYIKYANFNEVTHKSIDNTGFVITETDGINFRIIKTSRIKKF